MSARKPYPLHNGGLVPLQPYQREMLRIMESGGKLIYPFGGRKAPLRLESQKQETARVNQGCDPYNSSTPVQKRGRL